MIAEHGVPMIHGMAGSGAAYWARALDGELVQHSFWLFDTEENPRHAEATFNRLREMPSRSRNVRQRRRVRGRGADVAERRAGGPDRAARRTRGPASRSQRRRTRKPERAVRVGPDRLMRIM